MKPVEWGLLRWLTAMLAVLLAGVCVAAYFGLGGWSQALPVHTEAESGFIPVSTPLQPVIESSGIAQQSLFSLQRSQDVQSFGSVAGPTEVSDSQDWVLASMMITPSLTAAVLVPPGQAPIRVRLGETIPGSTWQFARAEARAAILIGPSGQRRLELRTFDGQGAELPSTAPIYPGAATPRAAATVMLNEPPSSAPENLTHQPPAAELNPEAAMRQRLAKRRAELQQQQNNQGPNRP